MTSGPIAPPPAARPAPSRGLRGALLHGAAWTGGANVGASLLGTVVGLALARILTPADFGIQTAIVTITAFLGSLVDTGLGTAVVQREELGQAELSSIFWCGLAASAGVYLVVLALTPAAARLFGAPALLRALPVAALNVIVTGVVIVPAALLRRRLAFARLARAQAAGAGAGAVVALAIAFAGGHYWALVGYSLAAVVVSALVIAASAGWRPSRGLRTAHLAPVRGYAGSMMSFLTVNYWSRNLDDLLIGRLLGVAPLGFYGLGQRLVSAPIQLLVGSITPLLHPTFAAMGDDVPRQRTAYLDLVHVTALCTIPLAAVLWVLAAPLVHAVAGDGWLPTVGVVRALAPWVAVQPVNALCGPVFMARDAAHVMLRCATVGAVAVVAGMLLGIGHGIVGVAWGYSLAYLLVAAPVSTLVAFRRLRGRPRELAAALATPLLAGATVLVVELALATLLAGRVAPAASFAVMALAALLALAIVAAPTARRLLASRPVRRVSSPAGERSA